MLHDLANDDDCVSLKWASEDREGWRHRERLPMLLMMTNILSSYVIICHHHHHFCLLIKLTYAT